MSIANPPSIDQLDRKPSEPRWRAYSLIWDKIRNRPDAQRDLLALFVERYKHEARFHLARLIGEGVLEPELIEILEKKFKIRKNALAHAIRSHQACGGKFFLGRAQWKEGIGRDNFEPYILLKSDPERRRVPIHILAHAPKRTLTRISIRPDLPTKSRRVQIETVRRLIAAHPDTEWGHRFIRWMGKPYSFAYRRTHEETWEFSPAGKLVETHREYCWESGVQLIVHGPVRSIAIEPRGAEDD